MGKYNPKHPFKIFEFILGRTCESSWMQQKEKSQCGEILRVNPNFENPNLWFVGWPCHCISPVWLNLKSSLKTLISRSLLLMWAWRLSLVHNPEFFQVLLLYTFGARCLCDSLHELLKSAQKRRSPPAVQFTILSVQKQQATSESSPVLHLSK